MGSANLFTKGTSVKFKKYINKYLPTEKDRALARKDLRNSIKGVLSTLLFVTVVILIFLHPIFLAILIGAALVITLGYILWTAFAPVRTEPERTTYEEEE